MMTNQITIEQLWLTVHQFLDELRNGHLQKQRLTTKEAAEYLGTSTSMLQKMARNREISYYKTKGLLYFERADLDNYVTKNRVLSDDEFMSNLKSEKK